jgi:hypothetical protein
MRLAIIGAMLVLGACTSAGGEEGSEGGQARSAGQRTFEVGAFESVSLEGAHDVIVTVGGAPSVRAEGDSEAIERLDIRVENGRLRIGSRRTGWFSGRRHRGDVTIHVTAPSLHGAAIAGAGDLRIDRVQAQAFAAEIAGAGDIEIGALQAQRASFSIAGAGGIRAAGTAQEASIDIAGSGSVGLEQLQTRRASVSIAGSGDVHVNATEEVDASIMGSGDVTVTGGARCNVSKLGSGNVRCG